MQTSNKVFMGIVLILLVMLVGVYIYSSQKKLPSPISMPVIEQASPSRMTFGIEEVSEESKLIQGILISSTDNLIIESVRSQELQSYELSIDLVVKKRITDQMTFEFTEVPALLSDIPESAPIFVGLNDLNQVDQIIWLTF